MESTDAILGAIEQARSDRPRIVIGISGFAGAGKSTLARELVSSIDRSARIRGDDFLDPARSHRRSGDWDGVERSRLRAEVIQPFRERVQATYRRFDWNTRQLAEPEALPDADVLVIDCIGLFHPELHGCFDLTIWVDLDPKTAAHRGQKRDRGLGRHHDALWEEVWVPNDRDFSAAFSPRETADLIYTSQPRTD